MTTITTTPHASEGGGMPTARLGPPRRLNGQRLERFLRGQCVNGGCTRSPRFRDTLHCFRCWAGIKWTSILQRVANVNGRCASYVGIPLGYTRSEFVAWVIANPPPEWMARPSIDRIVTPLGYVPGNIRWLEFRENCRSCGRFKR